MPTQIRRYDIDPALVDEWLLFFDDLTRLRATFGFRLVSAYLDRANSEFTWVVEHDEPFTAVEARYNASGERSAFFADRPRFVRAMHVSEVDTIASATAPTDQS
jgi:hypothetical protein